MRDFIEAILGDQRGNAVMAVATGRTETGKLRVDSSAWFSYPDEIDLMVAYAEKPRRGDRRNVYISPLIYGDELPIDRKTGKPKPTDREGRPQFSRGIDNAVSAGVIYMDSDLCPPEKFRIGPTIHVSTSEGHGHDYWVLSEPVPAKVAADVAHRITEAHKEDGCDPSGWSANKLLRMPTVNTKDPENVWTIEWDHTGAVYDLEEMQLAYPGEAVEEKLRRDVASDYGSIDDEGPIPQIADLPDHLELLARIPQSERRLNELIYKKPAVGEKGWRSEQRYALLLDLVRYGFAPEEVASIAWNTPAAAKWRQDQRGIDGLWYEIRKAVTQVTYERGMARQNAEADDLHAVKAQVKPVVLLTAEERLQALSRRSWIDEYVAWAESRFTISNRPYHKMMAWMALAMAFSGTTYAPKESGRMHPNLYMTGIGPSSSGKTDALRCLWDVVNAFHPSDSPDIGGNHSESALAERLLAREGKVSITWNDEADGMLATWKAGGWTTGVQSTITKVYDGFIPQLSRVGKQELQKSNARAYVSSLMIGTPEGMFGVLDRGMFRTGFLARQVWVLGEDQVVTRESMKTKQQAVERLHEEDPIPKLWADRFQRTITMLRGTLPAGHRMIPMLFTEEALERFDDAKWKLHEHFLGHGQQDIFKTAVRRMYDVMWKACVLFAVSEGSRWITTRHVLAVLTHVEEWIFNLETVAARISSSAFSRACDEIEQFIAGHDKQRVDAAKVYKLRNTESVRITDEYITALIRQGRVYETSPSAGQRVLHIAGKAQAPAEAEKTEGAERAREEELDGFYPFAD